MKQSLMIFGVILLGILIPDGHVLTFLIRYNLMIMLFFAFLKVEFNKDLLTVRHLWIVIANVLMAGLAYGLTYQLGHSISMAAFCVAIAPTAAAAPVIAVFLRSRVEFVTVSVLITSPVIAILLPLILPYMLVLDQEIKILDVLLPVAQVVFIPLLISLLVKKMGDRLNRFFAKGQFLPFYLFLINIWIASGRATTFVRDESDGPLNEIFLIAFITALICLANYKIGERIGGAALRYEASLALGRKNTMFVLWLALTFVNPLAALGPIFYILFQNIYNGFQIWEVEKNKKQLAIHSCF